MPTGIQNQSIIRIPRATYRLQFNEHFTLYDGIALVPYLAALGISHLYASPLFLARPHSTHGYDVCDFNRLNPEIGTEPEFELLVETLRRFEMGLVLDIVPNHMGIGTPENKWWWDVLKNGRESKFAGHFDIDWESPNPRLRGKVLAPILGDAYEGVLARGEIKLAIHEGEYVLRYFAHLFPVRPGLLPPLLSTGLGATSSNAAMDEINSVPKALDELLRQQNYVLCDWRKGDAELNYRRFFAITDLAAVRVEQPQVFEQAHGLLERWLRAGLLDGVRVDHPDGLRDPQQYLERLRKIAPTAWIVVEKILEPEEDLPVSWPVAGTTGYDFMNRVGGLFIDADGEKELTDFYLSFTGEPADYDAIVLEKKLSVLRTLFVAETDRLAELLARAATKRIEPAFSRPALNDAIIEIAACFPVYRTYIRPESNVAGETDVCQIEHAFAVARSRRSDLSATFDFLKDLLFLKRRGTAEDDFVSRFQQLAGAAMAKGVEDTAFYCYHRLLALNEVGGCPAQFGTDVESFHQATQSRADRWPSTMLATSTHDTKRSEDTRARLSVLSEIPGQWAAAVRRWSAMNERHRTDGLPDRNIEYHFYQILVGAWPISIERAKACLMKASWEAKQHTDWNNHNATYECALKDFVKEALSDEKFIEDLEKFLPPILEAGRINSFAQTLVKLTAPGVPDFYQGCELWDFSVVDPDNRRAVDFALRQTVLKESAALSAQVVWQRRAEGLPKLWMIQRVLSFRAQHPQLFNASGKYRPLAAQGAKRGHVVAFMRDEGAITIVPRLTLRLENDWADTSIEMPEGNWENIFTGKKVAQRTERLSNLLRDFPVALLARKESA